MSGVFCATHGPGDRSRLHTRPRAYADPFSEDYLPDSLGQGSAFQVSDEPRRELGIYLPNGDWRAFNPRPRMGFTR